MPPEAEEAPLGPRTVVLHCYFLLVLSRAEAPVDLSKPAGDQPCAEILVLEPISVIFSHEGGSYRSFSVNCRWKREQLLFF